MTEDNEPEQVDLSKLHRMMLIALGFVVALFFYYKIIFG